MSEELDRLKAIEKRLNRRITALEMCVEDPGIPDDEIRKTCVIGFKSKLKMLTEIRGEL